MNDEIKKQNIVDIMVTNKIDDKIKPIFSNDDFKIRLGFLVNKSGGTHKCAEIVNFGAAQINRWINSDVKMPLIAAIKLCYFLDISVDWLVFGVSVKLDIDKLSAAIRICEQQEFKNDADQKMKAAMIKTIYEEIS